MAKLCANEECPNPQEFEEDSPPIVMTQAGMKPLLFCSPGCVGEYYLQEEVDQGRLRKDVLDSYRHQRRMWPIE